jgi:hypothetical protein
MKMIGFFLCVIFVSSLWFSVIQLFSNNTKFHKGGSKRHKVTFETASNHPLTYVGIPMKGYSSVSSTTYRLLRTILICSLQAPATKK